MMSKFKIGDVVRVTDYPSYEGEVYSAEHVDEDGYQGVLYAFGDADFATEEDLELVHPAWTTLAELRPGAVFEIETGERWCKSLNRMHGRWPRCISLETGELLSLTDETKVRELAIP